MPTLMNSGNKANPAAPATPAAPAAPAGETPIGRVETVEGEATATRVDGTKVALATNTLIYQGDTIETGTGAKVGLLFADSSTFALGSDGQMVMDELVYDPKSHEGHSLATVAKGVFVFVSGEIAAHNPDAMQVKTPVMVIGVRGTKVAGVANPEGQENKVALLADEDGGVGSVVVTNDAGSVVLDAANEMTRILFGNVAPSVPEIVTQLIINEVFGDTLSFVPLLSEIGAATGLFDAIGGMFGGGSSEPAQGDAPADNNQNSDEGGGFFDSILPNSGGTDDGTGTGTTTTPGDGSWLDPLRPHQAAPGYSVFALGPHDGFAPSVEVPAPLSLA